MDATTIATIASAAVSLLAPYLQSVGEEVAKKAGAEIGKAAGKTVWEKAKQLFIAVRAKLSAKPSAAEALDALVKSPNDPDTQAAVLVQLKEAMASDQDFARKLTDILKDAAEAGADTVFSTTVFGEVQKLVQMGNVYGDVKI
jgi:hypothetical protein